ncbi:MAG: hypothetical protein ACJ8BW_09740 [Ktedonobacteraceae bacterium]
MAEVVAEAAFIVPLLRVSQTGWRLLCHYYGRDSAALVRKQVGLFIAQKNERHPSNYERPRALISNQPAKKVNCTFITEQAQTLSAGFGQCLLRPLLES